MVPIDTPKGRFNLMTFHASPPVFDGPEDRNGLRNRDEIRLWQVFLDGGLGPAPANRFVIAGDANLDPEGSEGRTEAIAALLSDPRLQDPAPGRSGDALRDPSSQDLDTVDWEGIGSPLIRPMGGVSFFRPIGVETSISGLLIGTQDYFIN